MIERLGAARENAQAVKGLKALGLTPDDVDFIGESPLEVSERLAQGIARTRANNPTALSPALSQIFGLENTSAALLFSDTAALRENIGKLGNPDRFNRGVQTFVGSRGAEDQRVRNEIEVRKAGRTELAKISQEKDLFEQQIIDEDRIGNKIPFFGFLGRKSQLLAFELARQVGFSKETAGIISETVGFGGGLSGSNRDEPGPNAIKINLEAKLTDARGAEVGNVSAVQGANEDE